MNILIEAKIKAAEEAARRAVVSSYSKYVEYVHEGRWYPGKHLLFINEKVEDLIYRRIPQRILIVSLPPQHGKSQDITETLPSYVLGKWPSKRVIEVSYGDDLARRFGRRNKQKIEQFGKQLFNIELSNNSRSDTEFEIEGHKGSMISRGIMAGITGQPGDVIIIDDPIKNRQEADSETYRERVWEEFLNSIYTRLSADGVIILIMTRWHEDDLAGRLMKTMPNDCIEVNIPLEAEDNDILGRNKGDALFPEIGKDNYWLQDFKKAYLTQEGNRAWLALMQGRPTAEEGNMIKRNWWQYYEKLPDMIQLVMSVDAAFKDEDTSDPVAIQVWGKRQANMYLIDSFNEVIDFPTTLQKITMIKAKYPRISRIYVEDKANGSAVIQMLRKKIPGIIAVNPEGGKVARVNAVSGAIESGNVYLPINAPFTNDFVEQCSSFPTGKHDDMVDAMSQALNRFMYYNAEIPVEVPEDVMTPHKQYHKTVKALASNAPRGII